MKRIRNRVQTVTGTGGGGGAVVGDVRWTPGSTLTKLQVRAVPSLKEVQAQFNPLPVRPTISLKEVLIEGMQAGTVSTNLVKGTTKRDYLMGSNSVTQTAVGGRSDWTNIANAQGVNNGTNATITSNALGARSGRLDLAYENIPDYTTFGFTVVSAHLDFYTTQTGTVLSNGGLSHQYSVGGGIVTLQSFVDDKSGVSTYDITSAITSQAAIDGLTAYANASFALAATTITATCDAVVFRMVVTHV